MYPVRQIVNAILLRAHESGHPITPLRVQKIFFFMWLQAKKGGIILLNESPRKFPFGPIFDSLYFELRIFKGSPIDTLIHDIDVSTGKAVMSIPCREDKAFWTILDSVWNQYSILSDRDLSILALEAFASELE